MKIAMVHDTPKAMKKYLHEHPKADPSDHSVKQHSDSGTGSSEPKKKSPVPAHMYEYIGPAAVAIHEAIMAGKPIPKEQAEKTIALMEDSIRKSKSGKAIVDPTVMRHYKALHKFLKQELSTGKTAMTSDDRKLRIGLIRVAHTLPKGDAGRKQILNLIASYDAENIGEDVPGSVGGVPGSENWKGEFTQQENREMQETYESGDMNPKTAGSKTVSTTVRATVNANKQGDNKIMGTITIDLKTKADEGATKLQFTADISGTTVSNFQTKPKISGTAAEHITMIYQQLVQEAVTKGLVK